jgi:hypothetical protein
MTLFWFLRLMHKDDRTFLEVALSRDSFCSLPEKHEVSIIYASSAMGKYCFRSDADSVQCSLLSEIVELIRIHRMENAYTSTVRKHET